MFLSQQASRSPFINYFCVNLSSLLSINLDKHVERKTAKTAGKISYDILYSFFVCVSVRPDVGTLMSATRGCYLDRISRKDGYTYCETNGVVTLLNAKFQARAKED